MLVGAGFSTPLVKQEGATVTFKLARLNYIGKEPTCEIDLAVRTMTTGSLDPAFARSGKLDGVPTDALIRAATTRVKKTSLAKR